MSAESERRVARRPTQPRGRARRDAIVEAAVHRFAQHGFRGTSVASVASDVGIRDASLLYWFPTKASLLLAVLAYHDVKHHDTVSAMVAPGGRAAIDRLGDWGAMMEDHRDMAALHVTLSGEHLHDGSDIHRYFRDRYAVILAVLIDRFDEAVERGEFRSCDTRAEASAMLAALDGQRLQWFFIDGISLADGVRRHVDLVLERLDV